jgi:5'-3' exonuclease
MGKAFSNMSNETTDGSNLMIVDGLNLAFRFKHANKKEFSVEYFNLIRSLQKSYDASKVFILGDGGSYYRKNIYPKYKANREELKAKQTEEEANEFQEYLVEFQKSLALLQTKGYSTLLFKGVEADDIAAYLTKKLKSKFNHVWLISSDKDWDLLIDENVSRFSYRTRKEVTNDNWYDHYLYERKEYISIKALMGDKGDNVPGVDGIGEKRAYTILKEFGPSALDIYDSIPLDKPYKYVQNLNDFKEQLLVNYKLMDLLTFCDDAIGSENIKIIDSITEEYI